MGQHPTPDPDPYKDEDLEALGTPVYAGSGLSVRALTAEELQRLLGAHAGQPTQPLGSGWAALDPPEHPFGVPQTLQRLYLRPLAALAARPSPSTGGGAVPSWPPGSAAWPGGHPWSPPPASPDQLSLGRPAWPGP